VSTCHYCGEKGHISHEKILTDRGTQFMSKIVKHVCSHFGIHQLKTACYRPQTNGILERFHATLVSVIRKSCTLKIDWAKQLDLAFFALRNMPHKDHNFTLYELVFGRRIHHVISYLASIWRDNLSEGLDTCTYMADLQDHLEVIRTEMAARTLEAKQSVREKQDHKSLRHSSAGDKVLFGTPGLSNKLVSSWEGPFQIKKVIGDLNYVISMVADGKSHKRTVHINHLKPYVEELMIINRVFVTTDAFDDCSLPDHDPLSHLSDSQSKELQSVLSSFQDIFSLVPGVTNIC